MKQEGNFFAALVVNRQFADGILNPQTRLATAKAGYLGEDFGIDEKDVKVFEQIGEAKDIGEFARKFKQLTENTNG